MALYAVISLLLLLAMTFEAIRTPVLGLAAPAFQILLQAARLLARVLRERLQARRSKGGFARNSLPAPGSRI